MAAHPSKRFDINVVDPTRLEEVEILIWSSDFLATTHEITVGYVITGNQEAQALHDSIVSGFG